MATEEEWSVANSDDERGESLNWTENGGHDIPLQILEYYQEIDKNKVLELQVKEYRQPAPVKSDKEKEEEEWNSTKDENKDQHVDAETHRSIGDEEETRATNAKKPIAEPSEFDEFDEIEECQGHIPKRAPKSGRLPKKRVGTLMNVISNLKKFRDLDNSISKDSTSDCCIEEKEDEKTKETDVQPQSYDALKEESGQTEDNL